jgi:hypothetical protein
MSDGFNLRARRAERAATRAAWREGKWAGLERLPLELGDHTVLLGPEFPLDVLAPLQEMDIDMGLVLRQALQIATAQDARAQLDDVSFLVNLIASNPKLPTELITAIKKITQELLGAEGYAALVAERPSPWDLGELVKELMGWYGIGLGESRRSSTPSTGGETSKPISNGSTDSTFEESGDVRVIPVSSESAASQP